MVKLKMPVKDPMGDDVFIFKQNNILDTDLYWCGHDFPLTGKN